MLSGAFSTMGRYWKPLFGMGVTAFAGATLLLVAAVLVAISAVADHWEAVTADDYWGTSSSQAPASEDWIPLAVALGVLIIIGTVVYVLAGALMQAAVPAILQQAVLGRPATFGAVWKRAWARVWAVIGTVFLTAVIALVPTLLAMTAFIGMIIYFVGGDDGVLPMLWIGIPGFLLLGPLAIWLYVKLSLAPSIVVFEDQGPVAALRRSSQLVGGAWWRILGISLLGYVMASMAGSLLQMPFSVMGSFPGLIDTEELAPGASAGTIVAAMSGLIVLMLVSQMISQLFSTIFPPLVVGLLYVDRRIRTEDLGPVLAEAAVVLPEQYGPPPATP
ncbi:hypothetical protein [Streptomyces sp. NPDC001787]|uniref:DUF7847 domain-containing protein n=1 Tax=Streptomyces sp. NPDC001787 TaxID=3154523 RepID=UPI00331BA60D